MLRGRLADLAAVFALATLTTMALAAFVLRSPSERIFGMEIAGRHHDPFTVMEQFTRPLSVGVYSQPITDITGALLERISGEVAAYNWLVLLSFPLSAAAAYLLARYLTISPPGAAIAAMAFAFSPFHLAHAAYHPHIAQTQWLPLYLLALWRCLDDVSVAAVGFLVAATVAVTLSNSYGGMIALVITPGAVAAYWLVSSRAGAHPMRRLGITVASLALIAAAGVAYASQVAGPLIVNREAFAFPRTDLFRYSAASWSYLVPPVGHPLLGAAARRAWSAAGVREGLLEQQVSIGWGIITLALIACAGWLAEVRSATRGERRRFTRVPVLVILAAISFLCSLSPEMTIGAFTFTRPSAFLYDVAPMFRSYARFGVLVQLMAALLAGIGVDRLRRAGTRRARIACVALVALAAGEYAAAPSALWRDVLPTTAHRWVAEQPGRVRALDCTPLDQESESVQWLTGDRVAMLGGSIRDCADVDLSRKLAAKGFTHLLVRRETSAGRWLTRGPVPNGLRIAARFTDGDVLAVTTLTPSIYTTTMNGFFPRERDSEWTWRWMGADAAWTIVNTGATPLLGTVGIEMSAFHRTRSIELRLDGRPVQTIVVEPARRIYEIGPLTVPPGDHELRFRAAETPTVADDVTGDGDRRRLSFALGASNWTVQKEQR